VRTDDRHRRTFVWSGGRLHPLPDGFQLFAPTRLRPFLASRLFSWPGKLRMALDVLLPRGGGLVPRALDRDESLGSFVRRRLGAEALERVAQPLVAGIYTADPDELSLAATMPRFLELERRERASRWPVAGGAAVLAGTSGARWGLFVSLAGMGSWSMPRRAPAREPLLERRVAGILAPAIGSSTWLRRQRERRRGRVARVTSRAGCSATSTRPPRRSWRCTTPLGHGHLAYRRPTSRILDGFSFVVPRVERRALLPARSEREDRAEARAWRCCAAFSAGPSTRGPGRSDELAAPRGPAARRPRRLGGTRSRPVGWPHAMPRYAWGTWIAWTPSARARQLPGLVWPERLSRGASPSACAPRRPPPRAPSASTRRRLPALS
jgi:hypothetical protein